MAVAHVYVYNDPVTGQRVIAFGPLPWERALDHDHALQYDLMRDWWECQLAKCDHRVTGETFAGRGLPPQPVSRGTG